MVSPSRAGDSPLLYYSPTSLGGLATYARAQSRALSQHIDVTFLCAEDDVACGDGGLTVAAVLPADRPGKSRPSLPRRLAHYGARANALHRRLDTEIERGGYRWVLFASYAEYLAPLWAWRHRRRHRQGVRFGAIVHDPVRDYQQGPRWWHRTAIAEAYSFLDLAFVHEDVALDTVRANPSLRTLTLPHGPYPLPTHTADRASVRAQLSIPSDAYLLLCFGHIRDGKNLDLVLRSMVDMPDVWLVVAGKEQSSGQRGADFYRRVADQLGVSNRCRFLVRYVEDQEAANLFAAADAAVMTYSRSFHSASGVLNNAAGCKLPVVASSGPGPLATLVKGYRLGVFVEPDSWVAIRDGVRRLRAERLKPRWDDYMREHSWERNAATVVDAFRELEQRDERL